MFYFHHLDCFTKYKFQEGQEQGISFVLYILCGIAWRKFSLVLAILFILFLFIFFVLQTYERKRKCKSNSAAGTNDRRSIELGQDDTRRYAPFGHTEAVLFTKR
jgi:hypothetical protein